MPRSSCEVEQCLKPIVSKGYCRFHYVRYLRNEPLDAPRLIDDPVERFWSKVDKTSECWVWNGSTTGKGYGHLYVDKTHYAAHRFAYIQVHGEIPPDLVLDHLCRNRRCVNPDHLEAVTNKENILRGAGPAMLIS